MAHLEMRAETRDLGLQVSLVARPMSRYLVTSSELPSDTAPTFATWDADEETRFWLGCPSQLMRISGGFGDYITLGYKSISTR
ncbi:hypothetical protein Scep_029942 [Stephania cephalantha]|uniref:Uncharacterized protein n=1 Tax=Stephania cephalantha TaxID=152367 RepID=A0AAP0DYP9_9MAGN